MFVVVVVVAVVVVVVAAAAAAAAVVVVWQHYKRNPTPANPLDPQETPASFKACGTLLTSFFHGSVWYSFSGLEQQSVLHLKLKRRLKHSQSIEPFIEPAVDVTLKIDY